MTDAIYEDRRLAAIYDALDPDRSDLDAYVAMAEEFDAKSALDLGSGTGTLAILLADLGIAVTAVEPAEASLEIARSKDGAAEVVWILGDAASIPLLQVDIAFMTANVAQVFLTDDEWMSTLRSARAALRPGGRLVFESRDPARKAWQHWGRDELLASVARAGFADAELRDAPDRPGREFVIVATR